MQLGIDEPSEENHLINSIAVYWDLFCQPSRKRRKNCWPPGSITVRGGFWRGGVLGNVTIELAFCTVNLNGSWFVPVQN